MKMDYLCYINLNKYINNSFYYIMQVVFLLTITACKLISIFVPFSVLRLLFSVHINVLITFAKPVGNGSRSKLDE